MIFGLWPTLAWAAEFVLETSGAVLAYRRRLNILFLLLAWRALADIITSFMHGRTYGYTMWAGRAVQYAILYALGIQLAAKMVQEYRPLTQYVYKAVALAASIATYVFVTTELWERKFLHAEAVSSLLLLAVVLVGWIGRKKGLEEPWKTISFGLICGTLGNAICAICAGFSPKALTLYPVPAILALLIWNVAPILEERREKRAQKTAEWAANLRRQIMAEYVPLNKTDPYTPRMDGNYLIRSACSSCGEGFDTHAMSNADAHWRAGIRLCGACRQVAEWQREEQSRA